MSVVPKQQLDKTKIIGFRVTEDELQDTIYPAMHDCYDLGIIDHDTLTSFLRFCVQFWMGHYRMKKQQFNMSQREIEQEKKKLDVIIAEKEAWHKWDNSTPRVTEKAVKEEEEGEQLEREFAETHPSSSTPKQQPRKQQPTTASKTTTVANLSLEDMMA
ncbi:MAG TPA: hypothetical protein VIP53_00045 [Nitrososphaera sp.]